MKKINNDCNEDENIGTYPIKSSSSGLEAWIGGAAGAGLLPREERIIPPKTVERVAMANLNN